MRYFGISALATGMMFMTACGGGNAEQAATTETPAAEAPAADVNAAGGFVFTPISGTIHEVKMVMDAKGYRFDPEVITIKSGDGIKYINVSGGPHDVAFDPAQAALSAPEVKGQLAANMPNTQSELHSPMIAQANEAYTVSFGKIPAGTYEAYCPVHIAMNMKQTINVQ